MSTYCLSDIHGNLDTLQLALKKIQFKYDGSDRLYILGDLIDWGKNSIETLLFCKELTEKYDFVEVLIGNHELTMLESINSGLLGNDVDSSGSINTWLLNGGVNTVGQYTELSDITKESIKKWLSGLHYFKEIEINGRKFYLTHSSPYDKHGETGVYGSLYRKMVWHRVERDSNPIYSILGDSDTTLIHGHTITEHYNSVDEDGRCKMYFDEDRQTIGIDCGAKMIGYNKLGRLGVLRLEDFKEFYIQE